MENGFFSKFKSGSDIRGTASDGVEGQPIDLTNENVDKMAKGFAVWITEKTGKTASSLTVTLGHDSRISAERLNNCVAKALSELGIKVLTVGLCSTPSMFMSTIDEKISADGAVMLTASHHPFNKNGLKFFTKDGGLEGSDITKILALAEKNQFSPASAKGTISSVNFMDTYSEILVNKVRTATGEKQPLKGLKIVVDAGNGAGGFYVEKVLKPLGADTEGSQFLDPDGNFPNHVPNPENPAAMKAVCDCVIRNKADFGIIFDTDVDRAGAVFASGEEINRNRLIALISAILLRETKGATIVTDSITSDGLSEFIEKKGGVHHRFKRGYKNVINEAIRLNKEGQYCPLAIETSGHAALKENYFLDDGAYLVTRLLIELSSLSKQGKKLEDLIHDLKMPLEEAEIRLGFALSDFASYGKMVLGDLKELCKESEKFRLAPVNHEGMRVSLSEKDGNGWFLIRMSLHDPIMPINIESNTKGGVMMIAKTLYSFLKSYEGLNLTNLEKFISPLDTGM